MQTVSLPSTLPAAGVESEGAVAAMLLDDRTWSYLEESSFSNGGRIRVGASRIISRNDLIVQLSRNKRVLHVGCADHAPLIEEKRRNGTYLHDLIGASASELTGIDADEPALHEMRRLGLSELYTTQSLPADRTFDLIVAPDVVEHVHNLDSFLKSLAGYGANVLITTPNAFRLRNRYLFKTELVNTDHRCWFSPYTLPKSIVDAGLTPIEFWYTDVAGFKAGALLRPWEIWLKRRYPLCRDGLAVLASTAGSA